MASLLLLVPLLPALGALINGIRAFARPLEPKNKKTTNFFALASTLLSALIASYLVATSGAAWEHSYYTWIPAGVGHVSGGFPADFTLYFAFRLDPLFSTLRIVLTRDRFPVYALPPGHL